MRSRARLCYRVVAGPENEPPGPPGLLSVEVGKAFAEFVGPRLVQFGVNPGRDLFVL